MDATTESAEDRERAGARSPAARGLVLIVERDRPTTLPYRFDNGPIELGREAPSGLADAHVSRRHARIACTAGGILVSDLHSRNGTFVDGVRIHGEAELSNPRVLRLGRNLFLFAHDVAPFEQYPVTLREGAVMGPLLRTAHAAIGRAARAGDGVLLCGESGVGKELGARHFHAQGPCPAGPFVAVNCAAIPPGLAERLLFGARRGAYSGATTHAEGYLQAAHRGTLFLDEIGELELAVQAKLLRALESKEVLPLGAARPALVDVRICAATLVDLRQAVAAGNFREDLFYRLAEHSVLLPPLRDRLEELPHLVAHELKVADLGVRATTAFIEACLLRPWPGNFRELKGEVRRCALVAREEGLEAIEGYHLGEHAGQQLKKARASEELTRDAVEAVLRQHGGNVSRTARVLNLHRNQLRRFLSRHGLNAKAWSDERRHQRGVNDAVGKPAGRSP